MKTSGNIKSLVEAKLHLERAIAELATVNAIMNTYLRPDPEMRSSFDAAASELGKIRTGFQQYLSRISAHARELEDEDQL